MKANWLPISAAVALALGSVTASAVDFHGYARAGMQTSTVGGSVYCLGNGNRGHKVGRLGDECDSYAEIALSQELYNKANNKWTLHTLVAYGTNEAGDTEAQIDQQGNSWQGVGGSGPWSEQRMSIRELWVGYDTDAGYSIWAGNRYYQRKDIHILDLYYLNNSGYGAGIENIDIGMGNLNFAITKFKNDGTKYTTGKNWEGKQNTVAAGNEAERNVYKLDLRWNAIPVGFGTVDASLIYALPFINKNYSRNDQSASNASDADADKYTYRATRANSGALITLDHASNITSDSLALMNHFVAQYGTNGFAYIGTFNPGSNHAGGNYVPDTEVQAVRLIDWGTLDVGDFGLGYSLLWSHVNSQKHHGDNAWVTTRSGWEYSIVLRPEYKWTEFTRTTLELGYSKQKTNSWVASDTTAKDPDAYKVTLAQQFTPGKGFWTRPAIRFYVSYLGGKQFAESWNTGYQGKEYHHHNYQVTVGTQVEAWW